MMRRSKKKVDPNAPPSPPRDNGLPPKPTDLDGARASLQAQLGPAVNVATGFGLQHGWCLFAFTNAVDLTIPAAHEGYAVVPRAMPVIPPKGSRR